MGTAIRMLAVLLVATPAFAQQSPVILELPPRYALQPLVGTPTSDTLDGPVATAQVRYAQAMAFAPDGSLYFADGAAIRRVTNGIVTTVAGVADRAGSVDGQGLDARFSSTIGGLAFSTDGTLWIADTGHHTIRRMTTDGVVSTIAGVPGVSGLAHGRGAAARFLSPQGVAVDTTGTIYVVDRNCTLRRMTPAGDVQLMTVMSGLCSATEGVAEFPHTLRTVYYGPVAVAVDGPGTVYVAKADFTVRRVTQTGVESLLAGVANSYGDTDGPLGTGRLNTLRSITVTPAGAVRVLEAFIWYTCPGCGIAQFHGQNAIREIAQDGTISTVRTLEPRIGEAGVGFVGLAVDAAGASVVGNNELRRVDRVAPDGSLAAWIGGAPRQNVFSLLAPTADGALMTAGSTTRQIRRVNADGTLGPVLHTTGGSIDGLVRLGADFYFNDDRTVGRLDASGGVSVVTTLDEYIEALAAAPDGTLVAILRSPSFPSAHRIVRITTAGVVTPVAAIESARSLAVSPTTGDIFYSQATVIHRISASGVASIAAGTSGAAPALVDGSAASARLVAPTRLRALADGTILFVDGVELNGSAWTSVVLRQVRVNGDVVSLWSGTTADLGDVEVTSTGEWYLIRGGAIYRAVPATTAPLAITTQPTSVTAQAGTSATFTIEATGGPAPVVRWLVSTNNGTTWTTLVDPPASGATGSRLILRNVSRAMHGYQYRATLADADETLASEVAILSVEGAAVSPSALRFTATKNGADGDLVFVTPEQTVALTFTSGAPAWTATTSVPWVVLQSDSTSGTGSGRLRVSIANPGNVIGASQALSGAVTITPADVSLPAITIPVDLAVYQTSSGTGLAPVGQVDTPAQGATGVQGALAMTGWVVDNVGVRHVRLYRQCLALDNPSSCQSLLGHTVVYVGEASVIPGARPDVEALYPTLPASNAAGWGFMILSNMLPNVPANSPSGGGVGTFSFIAVATDIEGNQTLLGRTVNDSTPTTVTVANDTIAKPFGTIDTPAQGATVSGALNNFGWALTPDPGTGVLIPIDGTTIHVFIDGASVGTATYNLCRGTVGPTVPTGVLCDDDVSTAFRGDGTRFRNLDAGLGPIALRTISTLALTNGLHTISWGVSDSAGRIEGIGSRYFNVLNSSADSATSELRNSGTSPANPGTSGPRDPGTPLFARTGFDVLSAYTPLVANAEGVPQVRIPELGRVELQIPGVTGGAQIVNGEFRALPIGVGIDTGRGIVTWAPGLGYLGTYRLTFVVQGSTGSTVHGSTVDVTVAPASTSDIPVRMHLDSADSALRTPHFALEGWAFDPQSASGAGIGAVHVWARKKASGVFFESDSAKKTPDVFFLGVADINIPRPDVAAAHGAQYPDAGFRLQTTLPPGEWDVTAYVWVLRTGRFEDARTVRKSSR